MDIFLIFLLVVIAIYLIIAGISEYYKNKWWSHNQDLDQAVRIANSCK